MGKNKVTKPKASRTVSRKRRSAAGADREDKDTNSEIGDRSELPAQRDRFGPLRRKRQRPDVRVADGQLIIRLPLIDPPQLSRSGNSHLIACTYGARQSKCIIADQPVMVVCTAFITGYGQPNFLDQFESFYDLLGINRTDDDEEVDDKEEADETETLTG
jgi:hypothetical protein